MAEKYSFVQGVFGTEFLQLKTTDNVYLKDLLEGTVLPSLALYNESVDTLAELVAYRFDDSTANQKKLFTDSEFGEIGDLEVPPSRPTQESWNYPQPLRRFGAGTKMTMEVFKQMTSKALVEYVNGVYLADRKLLLKTFFENMCTKTPSARVDCLTSILATPKAFWNDETSMDTPRPHGQVSFDGDHQHYILTDTTAVTDADDIAELTGLVREHENMGSAQLLLWVKPNTTPLTQIKALSGYRAIEVTAPLLGNPNAPYNQSGIVQTMVNGRKILGDSAQIVGTYAECLIVESPNMPANYVLCTAYFGNNSPFSPLGWREHPQFSGLILYSPTNENPIIGRDAQWRRYLSGYVNNRDAGACMLCSHSGSWVEPTFV